MQERIVASARGWLGTRFHHQGRVKKTAQQAGGVDCLGLLIGVARELDIKLADGSALCAYDKAHYSHYPDTQELRTTLASVMQEIPTSQIEAGDVLLLAIDHLPQHLAIVGKLGEDLTLIHAYAPARCVVEHGLDDRWRQHLVAAFRLPQACFEEASI